MLIVNTLLSINRTSRRLAVCVSTSRLQKVPNFAKFCRKSTVSTYLIKKIMESSFFNKITFKDFNWLNEPKEWGVVDDILTVKTDNKTDFWQGTWYNFHFNSGHTYGVHIKDDFTFTVCVEAEFKTLYDQAGLMIYLNEKHWLKAGIEFNDDQSMIGSVLTNGVSDWATGYFPGNPRKFWLRLTKSHGVVCVKYSTDNCSWILLRLCPFPEGPYFAGPMCCSPQREGLKVTFTGVNICEPAADILHSN